MTEHVSIFELLRQNPKYHQERSADWFRQKIKELGGQTLIERTELLKTTKDQQSFRLLPGTLVFYGYDPKHKETLPYYDRFPLTFVISIDKLGFTGINFHYLPIQIRIKLFDKMWQIAKNSKLQTQQVLQLNWQLLGSLSKFPEVVPSVKRYLFTHIQTRFIKIDLQDWKTAIMLENSQFSKMSVGNVRSISKQIIARQLSGKKKR